MGLEMLKNSQKTIGTKQTMKAVEKGLASCVFVAADAEKSDITFDRALLCQRCSHGGSSNHAVIR